MAKHNGIIINSKEWGVYLGTCMGMGFWSKLDPVGQESAATFESKEQAESHIASWDGEKPADAEFLEVKTDDLKYASIKECVAAGAELWSPNPEQEAAH